MALNFWTDPHANQAHHLTPNLESSTSSYLGSASTLKNVYQSAGHFLFVPDTDYWLQYRTQHSVIVSNKFCKLFVLLHGQNGDGLVSRFDTDRRSSALPFVRCGSADGVPLFRKLAASHTADGNVDQTNIIVLVLFLLLLNILVDVDSDAVYGWEARKLKVLAPEDIVSFCFACGTSE